MIPACHRDMKSWVFDLTKASFLHKSQWQGVLKSMTGSGISLLLFLFHHCYNYVANNTRSVSSFHVKNYCALYKKLITLLLSHRANSHWPNSYQGFPHVSKPGSFSLFHHAKIWYQTVFSMKLACCRSK